MACLKTRKIWTYAEIEILQELWGEKTIPQIAEKMGRSINSVKVKSTRLQLGAFKHSSEYLPPYQIAKILGVDTHAITRYWIPNCGLKFRLIAPLGKKKFSYIKFSHLIEWLKNNQDKWDSRRVELYALGQEPEWLKEKRIADKTIPINRFKKWSMHEDAQIICMFKQGKKYKDIALVLNRSVSSIHHRLNRINIWGVARRIENNGTTT